jgi:polyisoprenoid-binding protein YceI
MVFMIAELTLTVVANAYFQVLDEAPATGSYGAYRSTGGPWDASLQLGGPPNALRQARVGSTPHRLVLAPRSQGHPKPLPDSQIVELARWNRKVYVVVQTIEFSTTRREVSNMPQTVSSATIPGYRTGTWQIDPVHTDVSFSVRHMMVSKVRGQFTEFEGTIVTAEVPNDSTVTATIKLDSIDTRNEQRDNHIRSADFFEVEKYPTMTYRSTGLSGNGENWTIEGELSLHGVTRPVPLSLELNGFATDPYGGQRVGFSATTEINRRDFGIDISMPMDGGGVVVGDKISITLEVEAVLDQS